MEICSIGSSGISARDFFGLLKNKGITSLVDTRLNSSSQLAGFTKQDSLKYFLEELVNIPYLNEPLLAPKAEHLKLYRSGEITWDAYEKNYVETLSSRNVPASIDFKKWGERPALLCSEKTADFCHRRLAADFIESNSTFVRIITHL